MMTDDELEQLAAGTHDGGRFGGDELVRASATVALRVGRMSHELEQDRAERARRRQTATPVYARAVGSAIADAGGFAVVNLGGPTSGYQWYVRNLVVGGLTATTAAAGRADVYGTAVNVGAVTVEPPLTDWRDQAIALPLVAFYSPGELPLITNEKLVVVFSGATTGQQYTAAATVETLQEGVLAQTFGR